MASNKISPLPLGEGPGVRAVGPRKARNPYAQVALTYIRRPLASWPGRVLVVGWISVVVFASVLIGRGTDADSFGLVLAFSFLSLLSAMHMVQQFADSRAHLTPAFRHVHVVVAAAVGFGLALLLPAIVTWLLGLRSISMVASLTFLFGAFLCMLLYPSARLGWLMLVGGIATTWTPWGKVVLHQFLSGQYELQALGLFVAGMVMTLLGGVRLFEMNEDMPEYHRWNAMGRMTRPRPMEGAPSRGLPARFDEWLSERQMAAATHHARRASTSWWSGVCRWQVGLITGWLVWLLAFVAFHLTIVIWMTGQNPRKAEALLPMVMIVVLIPIQGLIWSLLWRWRVPMMAHELLLPVDRRTYVRQLGMAVAVSQLQLWAAISVGIALWFLLIDGQMYTFTNLAVLLGIITCLQPWLFGVGAWFVRYRHMGLLLVAIMLAIYGSMVPLGLYSAPIAPRLREGISLLLAGIVMMFGLLLTYDAYRRWLAADFD